MLLILTFISLSWSNPNQILKNGDLAYYGSDFYQKNRSDLKAKLYNILSAQHQTNSNEYDIIGSCKGENCYGHSPVGYESARHIMFGELYAKRDSAGTYVLDVYCHKKFYFQNVGQISSMGNIVNIEHTWPQSKFSKSYDKNMQKSDLHHLFPTDSKANGQRANHEFGENTHREFIPGKSCERSQLTEIAGHFVFTPPAEHKGNTARALFYFSIRYKLPIGEAEELILREWHRFDPIDEEEVRNNSLIAKYQKTRNPFIDFPELVEEVRDF